MTYNTKRNLLTGILIINLLSLLILFYILYKKEQQPSNSEDIVAFYINPEPFPIDLLTNKGNMNIKVLLTPIEYSNLYD